MNRPLESGRPRGTMATMARRHPNSGLRALGTRPIRRHVARMLAIPLRSVCRGKGLLILSRLSTWGCGGMYQFPKCRKCDYGDLVPFSDFGSQGAPIHFKAWVCTNPDCGYNIKIRNGDLFIDEPINDGQVHVSRSR